MKWQNVLDNLFCHIRIYSVPTFDMEMQLHIFCRFAISIFTYNKRGRKIQEIRQLFLQITY